jgi:DNA-binding HxlR family transcriptional regulator
MKERRSPCPISCTLDLLGDRWSLLVIRDLFAGKTHYREFLKSPERIATNILADRLEKLVEAGLVQALPSDARVGALSYTLTDRGRSLYPVVESIRDWALATIPCTAALVEVPEKQ